MQLYVMQLASRLRSYFETIDPDLTIDVLPLDSSDIDSSAAIMPRRSTILMNRTPSTTL